MKPQDNQSNTQNPNKGTDGTNKQYDQNQGNKGRNNISSKSKMIRKALKSKVNKRSAPVPSARQVGRGYVPAK